MMTARHKPRWARVCENGSPDHSVGRGRISTHHSFHLVCLPTIQTRFSCLTTYSIVATNAYFYFKQLINQSINQCVLKTSETRMSTTFLLASQLLLLFSVLQSIATSNNTTNSSKGISYFTASQTSRLVAGQHNSNWELFVSGIACSIVTSSCIRVYY